MEQDAANLPGKPNALYPNCSYTIDPGSTQNSVKTHNHIIKNNCQLQLNILTSLVSSLEKKMYRVKGEYRNCYQQNTREKSTYML